MPERHSLITVRVRIVSSLVALLLISCGSGDADDGEAGGLPDETTTIRTVPPGSLPDSTLGTTATIEPMTGEVPDDILAEVLADAADRSEVELDQLEVIRAESVEWPDGSLGCPRLGEFYIQMIVSGYWVEIRGPEQVYDYRLDESGNFRLCEESSGG